MSEHRSPKKFAVADSDLRRVDQACDSFEAAWKAGRRPRVEAYLGKMAEPERTELLEELIRLELDYRAQRGERPSQEEYTLRFPEREALIAAIFTEVASLKGGQAE